MAQVLPAWVLAGIIMALPLGIAAVIDARERRLPNSLAAALTLIGAAMALWCYGIEGFVGRLFVAVASCAVLVGLELVWRYVRHASGLGMGDIKALFPLLLVQPAAALAAFAFALLLLAAAGVVLRQRALPLLPFLAVAWLAVLVGAAMGL
ncbi:prepilin peptidase [Collinsella sp. An2]|uniref:prepilin peptidase n=1 Tax=Collinsella sp. An2 TaxID=1965585 RepID=UPI000B36EDB3|nr:prepilin peptidase [Collinsella sp. An2]OUP10146.1 hypothetical protein B5F33_03605 [Collinsella sp. An2]